MKKSNRKLSKGIVRASAAVAESPETITKTETDTVHCKASGSAIAPSAKWTVDEPVSFQWLPGGVTTINANFNGKPIELTVQCDESTATAVQSSFEKWTNRSRQVPFACVEHREEEAAFRLPKGVASFAWKDDPEPGVFCTALPTELGCRNVNGRIHNSFSPSFTTDADYAKASDKGGCMVFPSGARGSRQNPARVTGMAFSCGSITNKPAFLNIMPVKAKAAAVEAVAPSSADHVEASGTSEGVKKGWETRLGHLSHDEVVENVKRAWGKGKSLGEIGEAHGLHIDTTGGLGSMHKDIMAGNLNIRTNEEHNAARSSTAFHLDPEKIKKAQESHEQVMEIYKKAGIKASAPITLDDAIRASAAPASALDAAIAAGAKPLTLDDAIRASGVVKAGAPMGNRNAAGHRSAKASENSAVKLAAMYSDMADKESATANFIGDAAAHKGAANFHSIAAERHRQAIEAGGDSDYHTKQVQYHESVAFEHGHAIKKASFNSPDSGERAQAHENLHPNYATSTDLDAAIRASLNLPYQGEQPPQAATQ